MKIVLTGLFLSIFFSGCITTVAATVGAVSTAQEVEEDYDNNFIDYIEDKSTSMYYYLEDKFTE